MSDGSFVDFSYYVAKYRRPVLSSEPRRGVSLFAQHGYDGLISVKISLFGVINVDNELIIGIGSYVKL